MGAIAPLKARHCHYRVSSVNNRVFVGLQSNSLIHVRRQSKENKVHCLFTRIRGIASREFSLGIIRNDSRPGTNSATFHVNGLESKGHRKLVCLASSSSCTPCVSILSRIDDPRLATSGAGIHVKGLNNLAIGKHALAKRNVCVGNNVFRRDACCLRSKDAVRRAFRIVRNELHDRVRNMQDSVSKRGKGVLQGPSFTSSACC